MLSYDNAAPGFLEAVCHIIVNDYLSSFNL